MSVTVRIPSLLRQYAENKSEIILEGNTVGEVLENLKSRFPAINTTVFSTRMMGNLSFYVNEQDVRALNGMDTPVTDKDTLSIIFALAGG
jgi:molybdopterin converting factor small subunit